MPLPSRSRRAAGARTTTRPVARPVAPLAALLAALVLTGCTSGGADAPADVPGAGPGAAGQPGPSPEAQDVIELPADALLPLLPAPEEVPPGLVPLLNGSGPRDAAAIAAFSADPAAAQAALVERGFVRAYVAQYASPEDGRTLSVVVVRFADEAGAAADLAGDLAASTGEVVEAAPVGQQSELRRQPLAGGDGAELLLLRFRAGATTWLLAYGAPQAEVAVPVGLGQRLVVREGQA